MTEQNLHQAGVGSYSRYVGSLADVLKVKSGLNSTTHVASVRYGKGDKSQNILSVVKAFSYSNHFWANEAIAWILATRMGMSVPTHAALLILKAEHIVDDHGPELVAFAKGQKEAIVLWCTAVVRPGQQPSNVLGVNWQAGLLEKPFGRQLLAFDEFLGNVDRHEGNIVYLMSKGGTPVAIDNERLGYAQNWTQAAMVHMDVLRQLSSPLLTTLKSGLSSADAKRRKKYKVFLKDVTSISGGHQEVLTRSAVTITEIIEDNFKSSPHAADHLLSYLRERVTANAIYTRFGS